MLERSAKAVYLDNAASTPLDPAVIAAMQDALGSELITANASSTTHAAGRRAGQAIEAARAEVAALVGATARDVIFTSGATEADNLALFGTARYREQEGRHILSARTEHKAVTDALGELARQGFDVEWLPVDRHGVVTPQVVGSALRDDTILVALMAVNNEIGTIQDVAAIAALCREHGASCHVDAAQAVGKIDVNVAAIGADTVAVSAHKMHGPKGIGALIVNAPYAPRLAPLLHGGGQERRLRPGTPPTHQVVGFGAAAVAALANTAADRARISALSERLSRALTAVPDVTLNGAGAPRVPHIISVSVGGVYGDALVYAMEPIAISTGAACSTASREPSAVLTAMGLDDARAEATLRFSLGRFSTDADVTAAAQQFERAVRHLRHVSEWPAGAA